MEKFIAWGPAYCQTATDVYLLKDIKLLPNATFSLLDQVQHSYPL